MWAGPKECRSDGMPGRAEDSGEYDCSGVGGDGTPRHGMLFFAVPPQGTAASSSTTAAASSAAPESRLVRPTSAPMPEARFGRTGISGPASPAVTLPLPADGVSNMFSRPASVPYSASEGGAVVGSKALRQTFADEGDSKERQREGGKGHPEPHTLLSAAAAAAAVSRAAASARERQKGGSGGVAPQQDSGARGISARSDLATQGPGLEPPMHLLDS